MGWKRIVLNFSAILLIVPNIICPPVDQKKPDTHDSNDVSNNEPDDLGLEYNRYLKEVVQVLEGDPEFRKKLESSDPEDIRSGKIAKELEYVSHNVRSKLDELKRQEMERLRHLAVEQYEQSRGLGIPHNGRLKLPGHIDHKSPTFEMEDLRKLIIQTTKDLEEADRKRKEEFKQYEMQKEFEHREKLKNLDEEKRKEEERAWEDAQKKHKEHPKVHHPGSRQQLEEVWEKQDHLSPESFNPKTFFALHDIDGNGVWDADEVKALFSKELDKVYDPNAPEDDMAERFEEMERMREHVFNETDTNKDHLISYEEFLQQTMKDAFQRDPGWETIDQQPVYSQQEYLEFERRRQLEIQRLVEQGLLPPHPGMIHPNAVPQVYGMPQLPPMGQPPVYKPQGNQITHEEAAQFHQPNVAQQAYAQLHYGQQPGGQQQFVQPHYGQHQFVPQQQPVPQHQYAQQAQQYQYQPQQAVPQQPGQQQVVQQPIQQQAQQQILQQPVQYQAQQPVQQYAQQQIPQQPVQQQAQQIPQQPVQQQDQQQIPQQPVQQQGQQQIPQQPVQQQVPQQPLQHGAQQQIPQHPVQQQPAVRIK
nr:EOG090X0B17 [Cyclestheria hislopi]